MVYKILYHGYFTFMDEPIQAHLTFDISLYLVVSFSWLTYSNIRHTLLFSLYKKIFWIWYSLDTGVKGNYPILKLNHNAPAMIALTGQQDKRHACSVPVYHIVTAFNFCTQKFIAIIWTTNKCWPIFCSTW